MLKTKLFSIVLISTLLISACGFRIPNTAPINVSIVGDTNSVFVTEFKKHLDVNAMASLRVEIGKEAQRNQTISYKSDGNTSSYILVLSIPIKVQRNEKLLLSKNLTASTTLKEIASSRANALQIEHNFAQLRKTIIAKLLRILTQLNAY